MAANARTISKGVCALLVLVFSAPLSGNQQPAQQISACVEMHPNEARLQCYDRLFRSPTKHQPAEAPALPPIWYMRTIQEKKRKDDLLPLLNIKGNNVLVTIPSESAPEGAVLVIACKDNITLLQLHLEQPLQVSRTKVTLGWSAGLLTESWRARHGGHIVSGGRGMPAILTLKSLQDADDLIIGSELPELNGLRFRLGTFEHYLKPLRDSCGW